MANCKLLINSSKNNVVNKAISEIDEVVVQYKEPCDMLNPVIILPLRSNYLKCNYIYLSDFNRYYFVEEITCERQRLLISCRVDVLYSNRSKIKSLKGYCVRNEKKILESKGVFLDNEYPVRCDRIVREFKVGSLGTASELYLTVVGGV